MCRINWIRKIQLTNKLRALAFLPSKGPGKVFYASDETNGL